jgi:hypothetical protein
VSPDPCAGALVLCTPNPVIPTGLTPSEAAVLGQQVGIALAYVLLVLLFIVVIAISLSAIWAAGER